MRMRILLQTVRQFSMSSRRPSPDYWREAATLIVAAPVPNLGGSPPEQNANKRPYNVLMLKRGASSPFMPNSYVYPGGCVTSEDFDKAQWEGSFRNVTGSHSMDSITDSFDIPGRRVDMMKGNRSWTESLAPDVAFRICALRETFEESGLLFVTHKDSFVSDARNLSRSFPRTFVPRMYQMPEDFDTALWRKRVRSDPAMFRTLCLEYHVVPNIWALYEWCNWLTPTGKKLSEPPAKPRRYDTMFFLCYLQTQPDSAEACVDETTDAEWQTPKQWLEGHESKTLTMFGPQLFESGRLSALTDVGQLMEYTREREPLGLVQYFPVLCFCEDDFAFVLPGDEEYPENPDREGREDAREIPLTSQDFMLSGTRRNRSRAGEHPYYCNVMLPCGIFTNPAGTTKGHPSSDPWEAIAHSKKHKL